MLIPDPPRRRRGKARARLMLAAVAALGLFSGASLAAQNLQLHYDAPANTFNEALPLGNGRMGVMVYGGVQQARYSLSEISMFSGSRYDGADRDDAVNYLPKIRQLLLEGRNVDAEQLTNQHFTWSGEGANAHYGTYQGLGTLTLDFAANAAPVSDYRRRLDIPSATSDVRYTQDGVRYRRQMFVSAPDQVMVLHLSADRAGAGKCVARR